MEILTALAPAGRSQGLDMTPMLPVEEAQQRILSIVTPLANQTVLLREAAGRVVSAPVASAVDLPPFDGSAMDGYAVLAQDVRCASSESPVGLRLAGRVAAGEVFRGTVVRGSCVRLFTGSPLPAGADAVVMQEDTRLNPDRPDEIDFLDAVQPWENVRLQGEDVKRGAVLAAAGEHLTTGKVSVLAATGVSEVSVGRRPVVGLIATGSELVEPGQSLGPGQIYESNRVGLATLVSKAGGQPKVFPIVTDSLEMTRSLLEQACLECDAVVTSGGVSVGEFDFVKAAFEQFGGVLAFWRVDMKPGKPFAFGTWREKLFFGLPGNPVSALVTFLMLVRPALLRFQGALDVCLPRFPGVLAEDVVNGGDRRHFVRVTVGSAGEVRSAGMQASHALGSLARANGLVDIPPRAVWRAGQRVEVLRWE